MHRLKLLRRHQWVARALGQRRRDPAGAGGRPEAAPRSAWISRRLQKAHVAGGSSRVSGGGQSGACGWQPGARTQPGAMAGSLAPWQAAWRRDRQPGAVAGSLAPCSPASDRPVLGAAAAQSRSWSAPASRERKAAA